MSSSTQLRAKPPRGMRDLLPHEVALRDWATSVILETYKSFGFTRIETPCVESIELLKRGEGGENLSLIYEILKRGEKLEKAIADGGDSMRDSLSDLGLRFDLTVPLARFYANNQANIPNPFKSIQVGPVWRAESPQAGRYRQFTQCDIDIIGVKTMFAELDLLEATAEALIKLGFKTFTIRINDRRLLAEIAAYCQFEKSRFENVFIAVDKLDKIGLDGVATELSTAGHNPAAVEKLVALFKPIGALITDTTSGGIVHFEQIAALLPNFESTEVISELRQLIESIDSSSSGRFKIAFDPTLVRGMGYYTGPIFEVAIPGYSNSVAGGGRYDKMIEKFIDREVPACGFSIGFERIISILEEQGFRPPVSTEKIAFIYDPSRDAMKDVLQASQRLRSEGKSVSLTPKKKELRKQLDQLVEQGYSHFIAYKGDPDNLEVKPLSQS